MGRLLAKQLCWHYSNRLLSRNLNKRPMGHIAYVRNQYKPINTYDYVITLIKRGKIHMHCLHFENLMVLHLNKREFPLPKDALCQV